MSFETTYGKNCENCSAVNPPLRFSNNYLLKEPPLSALKGLGRAIGCTLFSNMAEGYLAVGPDSYVYHLAEYPDSVFKLYHSATFSELERYRVLMDKVNEYFKDIRLNVEGEEFSICFVPIDEIFSFNNCVVSRSRYITFINEYKRNSVLFLGGRLDGDWIYDEVVNGLFVGFGNDPLPTIVANNISVDDEKRIIYITDIFSKMSYLQVWERALSIS